MSLDLKPTLKVVLAHLHMKWPAYLRSNIVKISVSPLLRMLESWLIA